jgi:hypothetical protein
MFSLYSVSVLSRVRCTSVPVLARVHNCIYVLARVRDCTSVSDVCATVLLSLYLFVGATIHVLVRVGDCTSVPVLARACGWTYARDRTYAALRS